LKSKQLGYKYKKLKPKQQSKEDSKMIFV